MGQYLIYMVCDRVSYTSDSGRNTLHMEKVLPAS